ncbi:hypothetical protein F900_00502 [Acinetobacter modestus]|uniref:Uncharacterized protein n=1 Tax=Acinetobacter modestus TaxID=1776740 RepID=N9NEL8_9GAMM|nr:hypothetical protein [Acinetobacter modestus]ENX04011.1 hypothetical protein F900_00502 [Acinetobacter modestus]
MKKRMSRVQYRVELLPVLLEEMQSNLLHFDEDWNPFLSPDEVSEFDKKELAQARLLSLIEKVELFLTRILISKNNLFELELKSEIKDDAFQHRGPLEESFFSFNHIFIRWEICISQESLESGTDSFCQPIQYGIDLELCLKVFEGILPEHFKTPYTFLIFSHGKCSYRASGSFSHKVKGRVKDFNKFYYPRALSTNKPTFNHKKILNIAASQLRKILHSNSHTKLLNSINTNAIARQRRATEYVDSLFERYKSLTFVSMDLCFDHEMELARKQDILAAFKNGMRKHPVLDRIVGYLGKWEYSFIKDTYIRMIFVFPKLEQHVQDQIAEIIGAFWMKYTYGHGKFHRAYLACQPTKLNQTVCSITAKNKDLRTVFERRTLYYLTHSQEYYRYKYNNDYQGKRYKSLPEFSIEDDFGLEIRISEPRDIFFKGELTGEALERNLEKKRQRAEEKSQMEKEKNIEKLDEPESIEKTQTDA